MKRFWWQEEVVYQIYPRSFQDSNGDGIGDLRGIIQRLDYLKDLGVTMLWLCPIYASPMEDNGYDISDYRSIAPEFGTMQDFEELIQKSHQYDIKLMMDLVLNHTSDQHPWFQAALKDPESSYHDYYIFKKGTAPPNNWRSVFGGSVWEKVPNRNEFYFHNFGKGQPDLNWENPKLRQELYAIVNWWLEKGIAGFRIDAINYIKKDLSWRDFPPDGADGLAKSSKGSRNQAGMGEFLRELRRNTFDKHLCVTVAETAGAPYDELGDFIGEDGYFNMIFDFRYADLDIASGSEWFHRRNWTVKDLRERILTSQTEMQRFGWSANFIENHDQPRATSKYLMDDQHNPEAIKTLAAMYFFLRGMPFIYQGQELGVANFKRNDIQEFDDISSIDQYHRSIEEGYSQEEALHIVNLRSRDNARTPFPWNDERYGGFSVHTPWLSMTEEYPKCNACSQQGVSGSIYEFYKALIEYRQHGSYRDCLIYGDISALPCNDETIAYQRSSKDTTLACWFRFSSHGSYEILPEGNWNVVWHTQQAPEIKSGRLRLMPYQSVILKKEPVYTNNKEEK